MDVAMEVYELPGIRWFIVNICFVFNSLNIKKMYFSVFKSINN